ncbi:MAG: hypothetical protein ACI4TK_16340 [Agathobacter sp.]
MSKYIKVVIGKRVYQMSKTAWKEGIEPIAKESVPFGIYAVEKGGQIHMMNEHCKSITQLKKKKREYAANGFKVYTNQVM